MIKRVENKFILKIILWLTISTLLSLQADIQVAVKAGKKKKDLYYDKNFISEMLHSKERVKIMHTNHPIWMWYLGIVGFKDQKNADSILTMMKNYYPDAYIIHTKNAAQKVDNNKDKSLSNSLDTDDGDRNVNINFSNLSIEEFINIVSKITGKNILVNQTINGKVNFVGTKSIKKSKLLTLLNQVLLSKKLAIVDSKNGYLKIVKSSEALKSGPPLMNQSSIEEVQTAVLPLHTIQVMDVIQQARSLVSKSGKISVSTGTNSIIVTDYPSNIKAIKEIINVLNMQDGHKKIIKFIHFSNVDISSIFYKVDQMLRSYFSSYAKSQQVKAIKSPSANSIILVGNRANVQEVIKYVKAFDQSDDQQDKDIEMVFVKNSDAEKIAQILGELVSNKAFNSNLDNMIGRKGLKNIKKGSSKKKIHQIYSPTKEGINASKANITYDKQLNAVIIFGNKIEREVLKKIIKQLDIERKQVYVQARILEINDQKASQLGAQYGIVGGISNSSGLYALSSKLGLNSSQIGINLANSLNLSLPNASKALALGATISFLNKNSAANIVSEPSILCINNEESSIYVGKTISVVSESNIATKTTDISRNTYKREDVGLKLSILPRISSDNKVTLGVKISSEDILPGSIEGLPKTTKRVVQTSAIVKDGESIIIGGVSREKESKMRNGIPVLRNIPLLGKVFEREDISREKTTLVIVLTPYIINQSRDLSSLKEELGRLYAFEKKYASQIGLY